jgi:hypothetical protein
MFIFTPGFAFWYACTAGKRVESAQTVIVAELFWGCALKVVGPEPVPEVGLALAQALSVASAPAVTTAAATREGQYRRLRNDFIV